MNAAMKNRQQVSFKAWRLGKGDDDPHRGELRTYDHVEVKSHSKRGSYNIYDPLTREMRHINEIFIVEFEGARVYL